MTEHGNQPDWEPLEALLPLTLCAGFMWMYAVGLDDGSHVQAYKHSDTRRYLLLDEQACAYESFGDGVYRRMRHYDAIEQVFSACWVLHNASDEEKALLVEALDRASAADHADFESGLSIMPSSPASAFRMLPWDPLGGPRCRRSTAK